MVLYELKRDKEAKNEARTATHSLRAGRALEAGAAALDRAKIRRRGRSADRLRNAMDHERPRGRRKVFRAGSRVELRLRLSGQQFRSSGRRLALPQGLRRETV